MGEAELKKRMLEDQLEVMLSTLNYWKKWAPELPPDDRNELIKGIQKLQKAIQEQIEKLKQMQSKSSLFIHDM